MKPFPRDISRRMKVVRAAAEAKWDDVSVAVIELHGRWTIRSVNEAKHPDPYWEGDSLEAAEEAVRTAFDTQLQQQATCKRRRVVSQ